MSRNLVLLGLTILIGVGLAVWLLGGGLTPDGDDGIARDPDGGAGAGGLATEGEGGSDGSGTVDTDDGPVLFGRPRHERVGSGQVTGRLMAVETQTPVAGARILLAGTGYGDEVVALRAETTTDGVFRCTDVPAGEAYALRIEADEVPGRSLPDVTVRSGAATDLGTLWLGARVVFEGRVIDPDGRGVPNADVRAHAGYFSILDLFSSFTDFFSNLDREPEPLARTTTDTRGHFAFPALDPGAITLTVRAPGFQTESRQVVAAEGQTEEERLVVRLARGGVVAGRVVDAQGAGVADVRIASVSGQDPVSFLHKRSFANTGPDGAFRIDTAAPDADEIMLLASAPGHPLAMAKAKPGAEDVRIVLDRSATLVVRVLTAGSEEPIEGAKLLLGLKRSKEGKGGAPESILTGVTDATGRATLDAHPGRIEMAWVTSPGGRMGMWSPGGSVQAGMGMEGPTDPELKAGRREVTFRIRETILVEGTIQDTDEQPIRGARVITSTGFQMAKPVFADESGRFQVRVAKQGFALLLVSAPGYVPVQDLLSRPGADTGPRTLTLTRASVVTGRVTTRDGRPLAGVRVRARGGQEGGTAGLGVLEEPEGITGKQGRYVLDGVPPGDAVRILARHAAFADGVSKPFSVGSGGSAKAPDVVLEGGVDVEVVVRDPSGRPLSGATVLVDVAAADVPTWDRMNVFVREEKGLTTDAAGRVRQEHVPSGTLRVSVTHPDHAPGHAEHEIAAHSASPVRIEVQMPRGVVVAGQVLGDGGAPLEGVWVTVQWTEGGSFLSGRSDAEGRFRIESVPAGPITLSARHEGYQPHAEELAGGADGLVVRMTPYDPATVARLEEIQARLMELYTLMGSADDQQRGPLVEEIQALQAEQAELQTGN